MTQEIPETTYVPEVAENARKERERRTVQDGTALWKRRKEELERQKHREQREVCVVNGLVVPVGNADRCPAFISVSFFHPRSDKDRCRLQTSLRLRIYDVVSFGTPWPGIYECV